MLKLPGLIMPVEHSTIVLEVPRTAGGSVEIHPGGWVQTQGCLLRAKEMLNVHAFLLPPTRPSKHR